MKPNLINRCFHVATDSIEDIFFLTLKSCLGIIEKLKFYNKEDDR